MGLTEAIAIASLCIAVFYGLLGFITIWKMIGFLKETKRKETLTKGLEEKKDEGDEDGKEI